MDIESCGSAYFKEWDFTNDELDIREIIKKCESRKQRQEKRRKKKLKAETKKTDSPPPKAAKKKETAVDEDGNPVEADED